MQTPNKPDFYLKRSFDKSYSDYGIPYIDEACMTGISNNLVIYGHHMNDGSMFADLCKYTDADFCREHPTIAFDTLSSLGKYEVVTAFKFNTNRETFKYNEYIRSYRSCAFRSRSPAYARCAPRRRKPLPCWQTWSRWGHIPWWRR